MAIRFKTSGWRAIIADEFTFEKVRLVTKSICCYLRDSHKETRQKIIIGHDSRFMGEKFSEIASEIASDKGFNVLYCEKPAPTPAISYMIRSKGAAGGLNFTASHNPPEYQGIKFYTSDGASALPEITKQIEHIIESGPDIEDVSGGNIKRCDPSSNYLGDLRSKVNFDVVSRSGGRYAYDALWGTGRGYLDELLRSYGLEVEALRDWRDVTFGGMSPEPGANQLSELSETVKTKGLTLGLSTDGDGDRFGVVDSNGEFISPNLLIALLSDYLAESRGWKEGIARSVATTHFVDRVAENRGLKLYETPVGFKFIGELINEDKIILGGEESAGLSIKGHYPEKDGILACLLATEAVAARGASLTEQLEELEKRIGMPESGRIGVRLEKKIARGLKDKLSQEPLKIGGRKIENINRIDGVKYLFDDGSWMLIRPSGTEPLVRIYAESENKQDLEVLLEQGRKYLLE